MNVRVLNVSPQVPIIEVADHMTEYQAVTEPSRTKLRKIFECWFYEDICFFASEQEL